MPKIRTETLFPDFTSLIPQDGSVEICQDYTYLPEVHPIKIASGFPPGRLVLKLERVSADPQHPAQALTLLPGDFLRIQCLHSMQFRHVLRAVPSLGGLIVTLKDACNDDPTPGGEIRRVKSRCQHYIDMRIHGELEKGKLHRVGGRYVRLNK